MNFRNVLRLAVSLSTASLLAFSAGPARAQEGAAPAAAAPAAEPAKPAEQPAAAAPAAEQKPAEAAPAEGAGDGAGKGDGKGGGKGKLKKGNFKHLKACKADLKKMCSDVEPGEGRLFQCLLPRKAETSKGCQKALGKAELAHQWMEACGADVKSHCGEVKPGAGRVGKCLRGKADALSEGCKARMDAAKPKKDQKAEDKLADEMFKASVKGDDSAKPE